MTVWLSLQMQEAGRGVRPSAVPRAWAGEKARTSFSPELSLTQTMSRPLSRWCLVLPPGSSQSSLLKTLLDHFAPQFHGHSHLGSLLVLWLGRRCSQMVDIFLSDIVNNKFRFSANHFPQRPCCSTRVMADPPAWCSRSCHLVFTASLPYWFILFIYSLIYYLLLSF